jgi:hypothetical protein
LYYRENGANRGDLLALGDWLVLVAFVTDLASAATRLGKTIADEQWKAQSDAPMFVPTLAQSDFLQRFQEESETPLELLQHLWEMKGSESISVAATTSFEKRVSDLQKESQDHFTSLWRSRVVLKSSLYTLGLESLPPSPLKDQLSDLLSAHLVQDLVPNTIKRARMKNMIRTPNLSKQIGKLETEMAPSKSEKKLSPQDALGKFGKKTSLHPPTSAELTAAKKEHLDDMLAAIRKDTDGPRLFLSLVIILCASKREGVVYATGKFAPKLLKAIKGELEEEVYKRVEEIKELVKLGKVDEATRVEMRETAANAVKQWTQERSETDTQRVFEADGKVDNERWQTIYGDGSNASLKTAAEPLIGRVRNETIWGENGEGWISKEQGHDAKFDPKVGKN